MDYALKSRSIKAATELLDTVSQQAVDLDFTLPDYCADIEKILKCSLTPKIYTRSLSAGQLRIDGASVVRILYCDSNKSALRCCEQTLPFSATFPVNSEAGDHIIQASAKPEYLNCRALTPRRLTVHGAFSLHAAVIAGTSLDIFEENNSPELQTKCEKEQICELCEFSQDQFSVSEAVSLNAKSPVESIVRSELYAAITDSKHTGDKLMLKGEMTLRMLYICDAATGATDQFIYVFPFTQMLQGADPDCEITDIRLDVLSYEILLRSEPLSEDPVISLEAKLCASLMGYKPAEISYISDAYSTTQQTEPEYNTLTLCRDILPISASPTVKATLSLGDQNVQKIVDIFADESTAMADIRDSALSFSGKINVCILAQSDEGELLCIERQVDISHDEILQKQFSDAKRVCASVSSISYRLCDNNEIELRLELKLSAVLSTINSIRQVTYVNSLSDAAASCDHALTLYYAKKGEKVWEIAKRYGASMETLCDENSLTEDILSDNTMLLILRA